MYRIILALLLLIPQITEARQQQSLLLIDATTKSVIVSQDPGVVRSIASITKLVTAIVAYEHYSLDTELVVSGQLVGKIFNNTATVDQLITTLIIKSDNNAAETLAENYAGGRVAFIRSMNYKAQQLGLHNTVFADPTGLGVMNRSTAYEVASIMNYIMTVPKLSEVVGLRQATIVVQKKKNKSKTTTITNTNHALMSKHNSIVGSKTGFTNQAGWCVTIAVEEKGQRFIAVVLGTRGPADRNNQAEKLIKKIPTVVQIRRNPDLAYNNSTPSVAPFPAQRR